MFTTGERVSASMLLWAITNLLWLVEQGGKNDVARFRFARQNKNSDLDELA